MEGVDFAFSIGPPTGQVRIPVIIQGAALKMAIRPLTDPREMAFERSRVPAQVVCCSGMRLVCQMVTEEIVHRAS
jgi:hypothetical protein